MVAFFLTAGRIVVRRLINDWLMLTVLTLTVMAAMVQLAAAPMYNDAVTVGAMQRILADAPATDTTIIVEARAAPAHIREIDSMVAATAEEASGAVGSRIHVRLESAASYDLADAGIGGSGIDDKPTVASLSAPIGIKDHGSLLDGRWPTADDPDDAVLDAPVVDVPGLDASVVDVAVGERAAAELGVAVGDDVTLNDRHSGNDFTLRVVGVYRVDDPTSPFWLDDDLLIAGVSETRTTRAIGPFVVDQSVMFGGQAAVAPPRVVATWLIEPRLDRLTVGSVDELRRSLTRLPDQLERATADLSPEATSTTSAFDVTSSLSDLLIDTTRSLAVTRSGLYAVVAQLSLLSAMALAIGAGLLIETRRRETALLEARGIGRRQLITFALLEAVVLVVPVAAVAPWVAAALLRLLGRFGPLADIDLAVEAPVNAVALTTVAVAAAFVIVLLAWPSIRATTAVTNPLGHHRRRRVRQLTQSLGMDLALLGITAAAFWQLRAISSTPIARLANRFSVDPILIVTPALGLLTGAVLTLRVVPLMARVGERLATGGRSVIGALTGWQLSRRPGGQARAAFLLVMAISLGFFAASYAATWDDSQADQADFQVGADLRVRPNRRTNDSIGDIHLAASHEAIDQVDASMALHRLNGPLPGSDLGGSYVLLDAAKAADIVSLRADSAPDFARLMDALVDARPQLPGLRIDGEPDRLEFTFEVVEELLATDDPRFHGFFEEHPEEGDSAERADEGAVGTEGEEAADIVELLPPAFVGNVDVVVQDGNGFLHRIPLGVVESNVGRQVLGADLTEAVAADITLGPAYPLKVVDIQIRALAPLLVERDVTVDILGLVVVDDTGTADAVELTPTGDENWISSAQAQGSSIGRPSVAVSATDERVTLDLDTAASSPFSAAHVLFNVRPGTWSLPDALPVVVSRRWLSESRSDIGDQVSLGALRLLDDSATISGVIDAFPTVSPSTDHPVIVDLPTTQIVDYGPGRPIRTADEYWLSVTDATGADVAETLAAQPYDSVEVDRRQLRYVSLTTDPAALATIGAFTIGFVVASVFAILVFVAITAVSARERRSEFTLLRAFGLGPRQFVGWMTAEQLVVVVISVILGVAVGFGLSAAVLPLISIGQQGTPAVPPAIPRYPWATIIVVASAPLLALVSTVVLTALRRERDSLGAQLRDGVT